MPLLRKRRRLRRRELGRRRRFLAGVAFTLVLIASSLVHLSRLPPAPVPGAHPADDQAGDFLAFRTEPVEDAPAAGEQLTYPYSVIPGGAHSAESLRTAIAADPVVRLHYANFDLGKVRVVRLTEPRVAHVSYRIGDHVFWTRGALLLKSDETLLTDGVHYARTRCGNQLAVAPGATSAAEPSAEALETPIPPQHGPRVFPQ